MGAGPNGHPAAWNGQVDLVSLFWRIFTLNAAVLVVALALLVFTPATVSTPVLPAEAVVLLAGLIAVLVANAAMLRVGLSPLRRLTDIMTTIDLLRPGRRLAVDGPAEVADLLRTFNIMLDRLEDERATSNARVLSAQEAERRRVAQELHDEVGQSLTAVLLGLKRLVDQAPESMHRDLYEVQETTRDSLDEIRRIARRLRPGVLDELGLVSALKAVGNEGLRDYRRVGPVRDRTRPAPARARDRAGAVPGHSGGDHERDQARRGAAADHRSEPARGGGRVAHQRRRVRYERGGRGSGSSRDAGTSPADRRRPRRGGQPPRRDRDPPDRTRARRAVLIDA